MDTHVKLLKGRCRIGGRLFSSLARDTAYEVSEHKSEIDKYFGIKCSFDDPLVHPPCICTVCMAYIRWREREGKTGASASASCEAGCAAPYPWLDHVEDNCLVCNPIGKGGRPTKKKRKKLSASSDASTGTYTSSPRDDEDGLDMQLENFLKIASPLFTSAKPLSKDRMKTTFDALLCTLCSLIANQCIETPCCHRLFCGMCMYDWLGTHQSCPSCKATLFLSSCISPHTLLVSVLGDVEVSCDFASSSALIGCRQYVCC